MVQRSGVQIVADTIRSSDGRVVIDARLRDRRVTVRRDEGRRRLRLLSALGVIVVVLAVAYGVTRSPLMAVQSLEIVGTSHVSTAQVEKASHISKGVAMTDIDPKGAERGLRSLAWVADAKVSRNWPGDVKIVITERIPVAQVAIGKRWLLVDKTGAALEFRKNVDPKLTQITGVASGKPGDPIANASLLMPIVTRIPTALRDDIVAVHLGNDRAVELGLTSGGTVVLGGVDQLAAKFVAVATVLADVPPLGAQCTLDVAEPQSPHVAPADKCVPEPTP